MTVTSVNVYAVTPSYAPVLYVKTRAVEGAVKEKTAVQRAHAAAAPNPDREEPATVQV